MRTEGFNFIFLIFLFLFFGFWNAAAHVTGTQHANNLTLGIKCFDGLRLKPLTMLLTRGCFQPVIYKCRYRSAR
jgi:hypothetical protein